MTTAVKLLTDLTRLGIRLEAHGDRLRYSLRSAVTPEVAERLKTHKAELLAILERGGVQEVPVSWEDAIDPPDPCPKCGSLAAWQDCLGGWHCQRCDADTLARSRRLAERALGIRQRKQRHNVAHNAIKPTGPTQSTSKPSGF